MWVTLSDTFDDNPKIIAAGPAALAYILALVYCGRNRTDGFIPAGRKLGSAKDLTTLTSVGLWLEV